MAKGRFPLKATFLLFKLNSFPLFFSDIVLKGLIVVKIKTVSYIRELSDREKILTKRLVALCEREVRTTPQIL